MKFTLTFKLIVLSAVLLSGFISNIVFFSGQIETTSHNEHLSQLPQVVVAQVINERLTEWDEFTGRIQAPQTVQVRPRVSGYIDAVVFEEGAMVSAGDPLFLIDNKPLKAEVRRLKAELVSANSQLVLAKKEYKRAQNLVGSHAIAAGDVDSRLANQEQTQANAEAVRAALELAKLNLSYTNVTAPISGRVSNALITAGNYVAAGQNILTNIVSTEKVYAYFDADEQTHLKYSQLAKEGSRPSSRSTQNPVLMGLASDNDFPYHGFIDFVDNHVNESTGTIRGRAVFQNTDGSLIPGLFARIKLLGSASYQGILIDDKAIGTDLNNKFVLVLDENNMVQYRNVTLGERLNGLRIIKSGLSAGELIVVNGLQRVRPGGLVSPQVVDMTAPENLQALQSLQSKIDVSRSRAQFAVYKVTSSLFGGS